MSLRENLRLAAEKRFIQTYLYGPSHVYDTDDKDKITEHIQAQLKKLFNHRYDNLSYLDVNLTEEQSNDWGELRWAGFRPPFRRNIKKWMILSRNNVIGCKAEGRRRLYQMNAAVLDEEYEFNKTLPLSSLDKEELYNTQEYYDKYIKDVDKPQLVKLCKKIFNKDNIYMCAIGPKPLKQDVVMGVLSKLQ